MSDNQLLQRLGIALPVIQAPMAGGPTTPELAAAVSNAGGLGFLAAAYLPPEEVRRQIIETRRLTRRPFGVNTFAGGETTGAQDTAPMMAALRRWAVEFDVALPDPQALSDAASAGTASLQDVVDLVLEFDVPVFSVTFGVPDAPVVTALRERDVAVLATATTVREARMLHAAGVDAVIAQGAEAGAHRATFAAPFEDAMIGTMALVPQVVDVGVPVIASGGIMDGRGIAAALALGAVAVQMGTAFLACDEAATPAAWRHQLLSSAADDTCVTRVFSGRPARAIRNRFLNEMEAERVPVPPYPLQNALTRPIRRAAAARGDADGLSLWAGQGVGLIRSMPATHLMRLLATEIAASTNAP